ncbi:MAG: heavy metal translocating P-type ATPase [Thermoplasmata archaeon]
MATDPVCGMWVEERGSSLQLIRENRVYYFCSEACLHQFADPDREQRRLFLRLAVAWPLSIAVVILTYAFSSTDATLGAAGLATVVQFYAGATFYAGTRDAVRERSWNMDILIAVGTTTAYVYSLAALALPSRLPHDDYFDASALIITLILTGNYLEHLTRARAGSALRRLHELLPATAQVLRDDGVRTVPVGELVVGDRVRILPGGRLPVDGAIRAGRTTVDESLLTGESMPVPKGPGDRVLAASINGEGTVEVVATTVGSDTFLAQIGRLLTESEMSRVPLKRTADRIAAVFVPVVLILALVAAAAWFSLGGASLTIALLVFVAVAITACPCAFGIATPAAIVVGTGRAAEAGILFRGEDAIERAATIDLMLTDKTGTLTLGRPRLTRVHATAPVTEDELLGLASAIESGSEHPFAHAVVEAAEHRGIRHRLAEGIQSLPGIGVRGIVDGQEIEVLRESSSAASPGGPPGAGDSGGARVSVGGSASVVVRDGSVIGLLEFADEIAPGVPEALRALSQDGVGVVLVTGDNALAADSVARELGIREVHAGMTPAGKLELIQRFRTAGRRVAFVGDGINDAPAIAGADLGIAIGSGTEVAREAGQVILVRSDFRGVALALRLARRTVRKVRWNLSWAIGYNAVLLPVAMGALVPSFGLSVYDVLPVVGAVAMGLSSTTVVMNSLSLRWVALSRRPLRAPSSVTPAH